PASKLECAAVVIELLLILPAHAVAPLPVGGLLPIRQARVLLSDSGELRGENYAARVTGPMPGIEAGVVFRQIGIPAIAENVFDEIQVTDEIARSEETNLHPLFGRESRHFRANQRAEKE